MGKCLTSAQSDNVNTSKRERSTEPRKARRSGSMQYIWSDSWLNVIEDRTRHRMKGESELIKCNHSYDICNCVQRAIFVMNIYKFWNDRKHMLSLSVFIYVLITSRYKTFDIILANWILITLWRSLQLN